MAECCSSFENASNEVFEFVCGPCNVDGEVLQAIGYCYDCKDYLCDICFKHHRRPKPMRHHILVNENSMPKAIPAKDSESDVNTLKCKTHLGNIIEYYCKEHDFLGCAKCVFWDNHIKCEGRVCIKDTSRSIYDSQEYKSFEEKQQNQSDILEEISSSIIQLNEDVSLGYKRAKHNFKMFRTRLEVLLDNLEKDVDTEALKIHEEQSSALKLICQELDGVDVAFKKMKESSDKKKKFSQHYESFIAMKMDLRKMKENQDRIDTMRVNMKNISPIFYKPDLYIQKYVSTVKQFVEGQYKIIPGLKDEDEGGEHQDVPATAVYKSHTRERLLSPVEVQLHSHTVRVGTFKGAPVEPILLSKTGLNFFIGGKTGTYKFHIYPQEIQQCLARFDDNGNMLYFLTTQSCGIRTRKDLDMRPHVNQRQQPPEPYFDPCSLDMTHQMVAVFLKKIDIETRVQFLKHMVAFKTWGKQGDEGFFMELSAVESEEIMKQSTRKLPYIQYSQRGQGHQSLSLSPPKNALLDSGPIKTLLTYPPPPEKGGYTITNEDLYCLQEGEFLNDVIIDFYLKYLLLKRLSAEDRERTHIFSSFFYKCLTQKKIPTEIDEDPCLTLQAKRHTLVKTWTKKVDLFKKDYIVVPIVEDDHWFLAIVCFPGQQEPVSNPFIPEPLSLSQQETMYVYTSPQSMEDYIETEESEPVAGVHVKVEEDEILPKNASSIANMRQFTEKPCRGVPMKLGEGKIISKNAATGIKQPCIIIFDSVLRPSISRIVEVLKEYLQVEWTVKKGGELNKTLIKGCVPKVPQQHNNSDGGVFLIQYIESFFEDPNQDFTTPIKGIMDWFSKPRMDWFSKPRIDGKRKEIRDLIMSLKAKYES